MNERLQKLIAAAGLCSRRAAEEWIVQGKVTVNGDLARLGDSADPEKDQILVEGKPLPAAPQKTTTVLLYKPRGVVTTMQDEKGRPTVAALLPPELGRLYPVGRLDQFSEGLLLMTNDGDLANRLTHPKGEVNKTYRLWVSGWHEGALEQLRRPITLDGYRIKPPTVRLLWENSGVRDQGSGIKDQGSGIRGCRDGTLPSAASEPVGAVIGRPPEGSEDGDKRILRFAQNDGVGSGASDAPHGEGQGIALLEITIHEGRNRQIRRMAETAGLKTTRLKRIAEGPIQLGDLKPGQWRALTGSELARLKMEK